jgi:hypothetical protein
MILLKMWTLDFKVVFTRIFYFLFHYESIIWYDIFINCIWVVTRSQTINTTTNNKCNNTNNKRTTQITSNVKECRPCPVFASFTLAFALQLRKKYGETSVRVRKTPVRLKRTSVRVQCTYYQNTHTLQNSHKQTH